MFHKLLNFNSKLSTLLFSCQLAFSEERPGRRITGGPVIKPANHQATTGGVPNKEQAPEIAGGEFCRIILYFVNEFLHR